MPCIHPSEKPPLGWLVPCLAVGDLAASLDFYGNLDFVRMGGAVEEGWAVLRHRALEIHLFKEHITEDVLNFRGADVPAVTAALAARGLAPSTVRNDWSVLYRDPDGREVFFDTAPDERAAYGEGQPLTLPVPAADLRGGEGIDLGNLSWCLACGDLAATLRFYETLGMVRAGGEPEKGWAILGRVDHPVEFGKRVHGTHLGLFQGMIPRDTVNFRGGPVAEIAAVLAERGVPLGDGVVTAPDGGESLLFQDPDGRPILLDTTPAERLYGG